MPGPYVPPGYSPPFQVVDDLHHGAWVIIVVALGLVLSLVSFLIRLYVRLALHPPFGKDDYVLLGATVYRPSRPHKPNHSCELNRENDLTITYPPF
jgi:hypothetical protein